MEPERLDRTVMKHAEASTEAERQRRCSSPQRWGDGPISPTARRMLVGERGETGEVR